MSALVVALALVLASCGSSNSGSSSTTAKSQSSSTPVSGGTLTVLEANGGIGDWPQGLDPAHNSLSAEDEPMEDAIFGQLFTQNSKGQPQPDLASGYKFLNGGMTVDIFLRHGVTFTDGTPFNATAVKWNIERDLNPKNACICDPFFPIASITTQGAYTVVLHMKQVYSPIINSFSAIDSPNWIASPTAYQKMGAKAFALKPVGAGPFEVVSDEYSTQLVLKKNPNYWQKGHPYLDKLIFKNVGTPESGYEALLTGQAQVMQQVTALSVVQTAKKSSRVRVVTSPGVGTFALQLNTKTAPFNNIKAREAVYYALDQQAINQVITGGAGAVSQSGDGPASLYPILTVPGYRTHNLAKAKALVQQLGGLSFQIIGTAANQKTSVAEESQFAAAGMKVTIKTVPLETEVKAFETHSWQAIPGGGGGLDPELGAGGLAWRVLSTGPFTGIDNAHLDKLINEGTSTFSHSGRLAIYKQIYRYLSDNALLPFTYSQPFWNIASPKAYGPGLSVGMANSYLIYWPDVWVS